MSVIDDIAAHLTTAMIVGGSTGWAIYKDWIPPDPDKLVAIFPYPGANPEKGFSLRYPNFQIRVRGEADTAGYDAMRDKLEAIRANLHAITNDTVNSVSYAFVIAISSPLSLGRDKNNRPELSLNFRTAINN